MAQSDSEYWFIELDQDADAPRIARHALEEWLSDVPDHVRENALITVGELVANAVQFGRAPIQARASLGTDTLVLEVSDGGTDRPHRRVPSEDGGIGLNIVYLLADRVEIEADRSCVRATFGTTADIWEPAPVSPDDALYQVELVRQATTLRVVLRGDIDLTARPELDRLIAGLDPSRLDRVVIDLRDVTFFDSTGLHIAERIDRWGREHGVTVVFTVPIQPVMMALQAAGLAHRLTFSDALEDRPEPGPG